MFPMLLGLIDWKTAGLALCGVALSVVLYAWGHRDAAEACRAREFAAALEASQANVDSLNATAEDTARRTINLEADNGSLRAKVENYERSIANPVAPVAVAGVCRLSDDDARRLRDIGDAPRRR